MMKKMRLSFIVMLILVMLAACNGNGEQEVSENSSNGNDEQEVSENSSNDNGEGESTEQITLKIFQFKTVLVEPFEKLKEEFNSEHPNINLEIESVTGTNYETRLRAKLAGDEMLDIFMNEGFTDLENWMEQIEDLSDQPWVDSIIDVARDPMEVDGKLYGMPVGLEGIGYGYNKDMFEEAGISEVPTTIDELRDAGEKLQAAGMNGFINNYNTFFPLSMHLLNNAVAKQENPDAFIEALNNGEASFADNEIMQDWTELMDLTVKYGNGNGLTTEHTLARTKLIEEEYALMQTGNWNDSVIVDVNPDLNVGLMPMPINNDSALNDNIFVGVPMNWVVYKDSPNKDAAKEFLNWLVTSETGKRYVTEEFKFIPALDNIEASSELGPLAKDIVKYVEEDKVLGWYWPKYPDGVLQPISDSMQKYLAGNITADEMLQEFDQAWEQANR